MLRPIRVRVISGPDEGKSQTLLKGRLRIGTAQDNDLRLTDPVISRHHLEFQILDQGYLVLDLQSTNGTFYRGARIKEALVGQGAEIRVGSTVLRLEKSEELSSVVNDKQGFGGLIGTSPKMQQIFGILNAVAPTDATVLLQGETGTGKEVVAEEIHRNSPRKDRLFSVVDCGAMPASLIESELFGHERGAFTGAIDERIGVFERTRGGTVFLDEISELPLELQTRLLRVLDRRTIKRVGSNVMRNVDVRLIAATNRDLHQEVKENRFRQDLYYRLAVVRVILPPLRERHDDIRLLVQHFLWQAGCVNPSEVLTEDLLQVLYSRRWPGNVRELRNVIERATVLVDGGDMKAALEESTANKPPPHPQEEAIFIEPDSCPVIPQENNFNMQECLEKDYKTGKDLLIGCFERIYFEKMVARHGLNISRIARASGVDRHLVRKLLRKHELME